MRFSIECRKTKITTLESITKATCYPVNHSKLQENTCNQRKVGKDLCEPVTVDLVLLLAGPAVARQEHDSHDYNLHVVPQSHRLQDLQKPRNKSKYINIIYKFCLATEAQRLNHYRTRVV